MGLLPFGFMIGVFDMRRAISGLMLGVLVALGGCYTVSTPSQRFCNHFKVQEAESHHMTPEKAREVLLAKLPRGTLESDIYVFLKESGVGTDDLSAYYPAGDERRIFCRIDPDNRYFSPFNPKPKGYAIFFQLDNRHTLYDIIVEPWPLGAPDIKAKQRADIATQGNPKTGDLKIASGPAQPPMR